jgi:hypothetical protein
VRIWYGLSGESTVVHWFRVAGVPKTGKDLPESLFTRRKKELFDFDGESGKTGESAAPNAPLFAKLCSHIRLVSTALIRQDIGTDRQDIAALLDSLPPGTVAQ